jgi:cold shock CspA family protein
MDSVYKTGILRKWNAIRGFGFVEVPSSTYPIPTYFLHFSMIQEGPCPPPVGSIVRFEPGPKRKEGDLPTCQKAWIVILPETPAAKPTAEAL